MCGTFLTFDIMLHNCWVINFEYEIYYIVPILIETVYLFCDKQSLIGLLLVYIHSNFMLLYFTKTTKLYHKWGISTNFCVKK